MEAFEKDTTIMFTFVSSVAPDAAPGFIVTEAMSDTVVASFTAATSDTTHYYALFTMPGSELNYLARWLAVATFNSSARNFYKSQAFKVVDVRPLD